jgi:hypothetical protein
MNFLKPELSSVVKPHPVYNELLIHINPGYLEEIILTK